MGQYMLLLAGRAAQPQAESAEAAVQIAKQAPHIALGGSVIVRPCLEVPRPAGSPQ